MRPASQMYPLMGIGNARINFITITHQGTTRTQAGKVLFGRPRTPALRITEEANGVFPAYDLCPQVTLALSFLAGFIEDLNRCLISMQDGGLKEIVFEEIDHGPDGFANPDDTRCQRIAGEIASEAGKQGGLTVKR